MLFKRCPCPKADQESCKHHWWYRFETDGKPYRRTTKTANAKIAEKIEIKRRAAIIEDREQVGPKKLYRLSKHIEEYKAYTKHKNKTSTKDDALFGRFLDIVKDRPLHQVAPEMIEHWKITRATQVKRSTVNRELGSIKGCFSRAVEWKRLKESPCGKLVRLFKLDNTRTRVLSRAELMTIMALDDPFTTLLAWVTLETLSRLSEALGIKRQHIGERSVEILKKGGKVVQVPILPRLRDAMLARAHPVSGYVFGEGVLGHPPIQSTASTRVSKALHDAGIPDATHHTFRHTGTTLMLENGVNPRAIQTLAGWTSLRMLERYGHTRDQELLKAVTGSASYVESIQPGSARPELTPAQIPSQRLRLPEAINGEVVESATT